MEPESAYRTDFAEMTVAGQLWGALAQVTKIATHIEVLQLHVENAVRCAAANARPHDDLDVLSREIDALRELLGEKVDQTLRRLALEETGSRG